MINEEEKQAIEWSLGKEEGSSAHVLREGLIEREERIERCRKVVQPIADMIRGIEIRADLEIKQHVHDPWYVRWWDKLTLKLAIASSCCRR